MLFHFVLFKLLYKNLKKLSKVNIYSVRYCYILVTHLMAAEVRI